MNTALKNRLTDAGVFGLLTAPLWLSGIFAVINPHDMVMTDKEGNLLSRLTTTMECQQRGGCFSFDKTGRIEQVVGVGNGWIYRFNAQAQPRITHYIAAPRLGGVVHTEHQSPDVAHIAHAHKLHASVCTAIKQHNLTGYGALNCQVG